MHPVLTQQLAAQHIAELHRQAAKQRLLRGLRTGPGRAPRRRGRWRVRWLFRRPRPITA